jgi:predicted TIM-barrel fold metal-dependent hydrolase
MSGRDSDRQNGAGRVSKTFPVFDCDAHVNDPDEIWSEYVEPAYRDLVRQSYWKDSHQAILNGRTQVIGGGAYDFPGYNPICLAGPQMTKKVARRLQQIGLTAEQKKYVEHPGAYDPHARLKEMDLMGIDQVMIIPTMMVANFPFVENVDGAYAFARAYNNWVRDYCAAAPTRLFPAGWLPLQSIHYTLEEMDRIAKMGFRVALVRPIDARGKYPNYIFPGFTGGAPTATMDRVFRKFEETGLVLGMHTFPAVHPEMGAGFRLPTPPLDMTSPGDLVGRAGEMATGGRMVDVQTLSFIFEAVTWLGQVLLAGMLDLYPRLRMAIFESNSSWLPPLLEHWDRLFTLYANERVLKTDRLPSQAFYQQCYIAFESDEIATFRQWDRFEDVGVWSSDAYHHDGADSWSAIREMREAGVPEPVQAKLLGGNARRMYGIEGTLAVADEPPPIERPAWFPGGEELERWAEAEADPRAHGITHFDLAKLDPRILMQALRPY